MQENEYARMRELEDHYWWFVARRALALKLLRRFSSLGRQPLGSGADEIASRAPRVLDLGCGTGVVLAELGQVAPAVGFDFSLLALNYCRERSLSRLVQGNAEALPFVGGSFDAIVALDIFEHLCDDGAAFMESCRALRDGGLLVLSVPAFMKLWGPHDVALMHFRRYRRAELKKKLEEAGFEVRFASYSVFLLFPVVAIVRFFEKRRKGPAEASLPPIPNWMNKTLVWIQALESSLMSRVSLPWGSSVVAVAQKRASSARL